MKRNVEFKNFAPPQKVRDMIERLVQKVEKRAKIFPPDEVFLRLTGSAAERIERGDRGIM
jgi:transcriptional regulatory protein LevR